MDLQQEIAGRSDAHGLDPARVIELAQKLQEKARANDRAVLHETGRELGIEGRYVDAAISQLQRAPLAPKAAPEKSRVGWALVFIGLFAVVFVGVITVKVVSGVGLSFSDSSLNPSLEDAFRRQIALINESRPLLGKQAEHLDELVEKFRLAQSKQDRLAIMVRINEGLDTGVFFADAMGVKGQSILAENRSLSKIFFFATE